MFARMTFFTHCFSQDQCWLISIVFSRCSSTSLGRSRIFLFPTETTHVQLINLLGVCFFCLGCLAVTDRTRWAQKAPQRFRSLGLRRVWGCAIICGVIGLLTYAQTIANVGGFTAAYGESYGGGWSDYGYLRDAPMLSVSAAIICLTVIPKESWRPVHKIFAALLGVPWLIQGLFGARRGPTIMIIVAVGFAGFMGVNRRQKLVVTLAAGLGLGLLALLLVHNRGRIFIGSEEQIDTDVADEAFGANAMNEYVYGTSALINAEHEDSYFWGRRVLAQLFVRPSAVRGNSAAGASPGARRACRS